MLKVTTQKEVLDFASVFKIDKTSPSNLSWNTEVKCGIYNNVLKCWVGKHCNHLSKTTGRYKVEFKNKIYEVSRIIFCIHTGKDYFDKSFIVDHIDGDTLNNDTDNLRSVTASGNMRNVAKRNTTEHTGVNLHTSNKDFPYWRARWTDLSGKQCEKLFSVNKLGFDKAKECAILYRQQMIEHLNKQGAGYTERHGT